MGNGGADKVQANIVAAKYDVARLTQTRGTAVAADLPTPGAANKSSNPRAAR